MKNSGQVIVHRFFWALKGKGKGESTELLSQKSPSQREENQLEGWNQGTY